MRKPLEPVSRVGSLTIPISENCFRAYLRNERLDRDIHNVRFTACLLCQRVKMEPRMLIQPFFEIHRLVV